MGTKKVDKLQRLLRLVKVKLEYVLTKIGFFRI
jgi:hypothetical protein